MEDFTPFSALIGGALIGVSATLFRWANGRIAGISGILGGLIFAPKSEFTWRLLFLLGLLSAMVTYMLLSGGAPDIQIQSTPVVTILAGLFVGFGTRMGSGCTSGHGICGIARFSKRSFSATAVFMLTGFITVYVSRHLLGLGL